MTGLRLNLSYWNKVVHLSSLPSWNFLLILRIVKICVVKTLSHYLERTQLFREQESKLFLTYQKPYHAVSAIAMSRWIKCILKQAGIDTTKLSIVIALGLRPLLQLNEQECPSWTYLALGGGPQNAPLLGITVYLFKRKIISLKLFVTLKPGYCWLTCLSSFYCYIYLYFSFWLCKGYL